MGRKVQVREIVEVAPPVQWTREINMPDPAMFAGEWFAARKEREERERQNAILARKEEREDKVADVLAHILLYALGLLFIGGSLAGYIAALMWIGTP